MTSLLPKPVQGDADWRSYRCLKLENGVTVCLVHDKESKTTAAAATVNAGAAMDPRSLSGLAHFCEHMCFLGSEKYPGENEYKSFLAQHGGRSNASTSMHLTTYKFEILADFAEHAIDVFSNFFIAPLFTQSGTARELNAVDSENSKNLISDGRRRLQILKSLGDPNHYYTKFSTGNAKTLPTETNLEHVRGALLAFHRKHYRPENLTVVVAGPQSLDVLEEWVVPRFAPMKAKPFPIDADNMTDEERLVEEAANEAPPYHFESPEQPFQPAFRPELQKQNKWPVLYTVKPVRSVRRLVLMFPIPSVLKHPDQSPSSIISHLLGHEGPNSSFAILQNAGLLSSLSAGPRVVAPDFTLFQVDIMLTEDGEKRWREVADVIFDHCRLIAETADKKDKSLNRIWHEKATLGAMFFHQNSPSGVYDLAPSLSTSIVMYGTEQSLAAGSMLKENADTLPIDKVQKIAKMLVPSNCIIERCSEAAWDEIEKDSSAIKQTEQWYGVDYFLSSIDEQTIACWERKNGYQPLFKDNDGHHLALPIPNRFVPRTLELCPDLPEEAKQGPRIDKEIDPPNLIVNDSTIGRLWHRLDDRYALPKSSLSFLIRNAAVENVKVDDRWEYSASASVQSTLLSSIFSDSLAQETYDAALAGLHWNLSLSSDGVRLSCSGFSDRLPDLSLFLLKRFLSEEFLSEAHFHTGKDKILRNLRNYFQSRRADSHSVYYRDFALAAVDNGLDGAIEAAELATIESVREHYRRIISNRESYVDCLFTGNVSEKEARDFFMGAKEIFISAQVQAGNTNMWIPGLHERRLPLGDDVELHFASKNDQEENGSVVVTFQSPVPGFRGVSLSAPQSLQSSAAIRLICHMLREPLFDELRTKQTLGYIVSSYYDVGFSTAPQNYDIPWSQPVDFIVISVLSRKVAPPEVLRRIDEFLVGFRESLLKMPDSEIDDYASALSTKLLKPIQKLSAEATTHYYKMKRYAPEILLTGKELSWDNAKVMASTVRSLRRKELLDTWDRMMLPGKRCRIVSCVYGKTFPLQAEKILKHKKHRFSMSSSSKTTVIVDNLSEIIKFRERLSVYDTTPTTPIIRKTDNSPIKLLLSKPAVKVGAAALVLGTAGFIAANWALGGSRSDKKSTK